MKFKSIIAFLLVVFMVASVTGCGGDTSTTSSVANNDDFFTDSEVEMETSSEDTTVNGTTQSTSSTSGEGNTVSDNKVNGKTWQEVLKSMPTSLNGTTVTMYNWNPASEYTGAPTVIKNFEAETGIKVKWVTEAYETYMSKLAALVASDKAPDVVRTLRPDPTGLKSLQSIDACKYDFSDAAWDSILMKDYTYNGKCYATSVANTHIGAVTMLLYNKSLIKKYDLDDPYQLWKSGKWTYDKFIELCKSYKKDSGADFACGGQDWSRLSQMYNVSGPIGFDGTKFVNQVNDSKFVTVTQQIADLYNTDKLIAFWKADEFNNGDTLFWIGGAVFARRQNAYFGSLKDSGALNVVPMPSVAGQTYYQDMSEYEAYGIAKGAKNAQAVPYLLRYLLDSENYDLSSFFCSKQALEVYNWCMSQQNKVWTTGYSYASEFYGSSGDDVFWEGINQLPSAQIISFINSNKSIIQARVDRLNKSLSDLK